MKWIVGGILAAIVGYAGYLVNYLGALKTVKLSEGEASVMYLLGKEHVGPYHKIVPTINEVENWAREKKIDCTRSFGLYLDNPAQVEEARMKSWGGCVVEAASLGDLPEGFVIQEFSAPYFVKAVFEGSPGIGPMKVYPKVEKYFAEKNLARLPRVLEVYIVHSQTAMTTTYYFPAEKPAQVSP